MFEQKVVTGGLSSALTFAEVVYHSIVRNVRKTHGNALYGLIMNVLQTIIMIAGFYMMAILLNMRGAAVRGDYVLYLMSGIFLYMTHTKTMGAVVGSEGPASPMMQHAPMTTAISITSAALAALYMQILSAGVVLSGYHLFFTAITIADPIGVMGMFLLAWFSGFAVGMVFLAAKPWAPDFVGILSSVYARANMIASGKMFLANLLSGAKLAMFDWNPLFHIIDQARGDMFANYFPHHSNVVYAINVSLALLMIGLMGEFFTRRHASASWSARR